MVFRANKYAFYPHKASRFKQTKMYMWLVWLSNCYLWSLKSHRMMTIQHNLQSLTFMFPFFRLLWKYFVWNESITIPCYAIFLEYDCIFHTIMADVFSIKPQIGVSPNLIYNLIWSGGTPPIFWHNLADLNEWRVVQSNCL